MFKVLAVTEPDLTAVAGLSDEPPAPGDRKHHDVRIVAALGHSRPAPRLLHPRGRRIRAESIKASMAASARTTIRPMSRKIAAGWPSRWASRRSVCSARTRSIRPTPWWRPDRGRATSRAPTRSSRGTEGIAIGVTAADCGPILFADPSARVIGAAHAGWKGALTGVLESTIDAMEKLGADRSGIVAAIGPLIRQHSYEVGSEFVERFWMPTPRMARSSSPRIARAIRCSISPASSGCGWRMPAC